jgi:hypothetical protein
MIVAFDGDIVGAFVDGSGHTMFPKQYVPKGHNVLSLHVTNENEHDERI